MNDPTDEEKVKYILNFFKWIFILILLIISLISIASENIVLAFYFLFIIFILK
jgi:hypothetical protein